MDEQKTAPAKKPVGIDWTEFKPRWDSRKFARLMKERGLTTHKAVTSGQRPALEVLRECWQAELVNINQFARESEQRGG